MRKYVPLLIAGSALIAAACRDSVAPNSATEVASLSKFDQSFAAFVGSSDESNAQSFTFELSPNGGRGLKVGDFTLDYEANAVCDPATSGYGPGYWKKRCDTLDESITITATTWQSHGRVYAEFTPDVRFAPGKDVTLSVVREEIIGRRLRALDVFNYNIWYVQRVGETGFFVDEAWGDPHVRTHFNTRTGVVSRNIRHFSGWSVRSGECETKIVLSDDGALSETTICVPIIEEEGR